MKISTELFLWLKGLHLVEANEYNTLEDTQEVSELSQNEINTGVTMLSLIKKICELKRLHFEFPKEEKASQALNNARKLRNWKLAFAQLVILAMPVEKAIQRLVINGDQGMIVDVYNSVHKKFGGGLSKVELKGLVEELDLAESRIMSSKKLSATRKTTESTFLRSSLPTIGSNLTRNFSYGGGKLPLITDFNMTGASQLAPLDIDILGKI